MYCIYRLSEWLNELSKEIDKNPPKKYIEAVTNLQHFIDTVEGGLLSERAVMSDEKTMEEQLEQLSVLQKTLRKYESDLKYVNVTGQEFIAKIDSDNQTQTMKDQLQDLNTKWSDLPIILEERQQKLINGKCIINLSLSRIHFYSYRFELDIDLLKSFNVEASSFESWLDKSNNYLNEISKDNIVDDVEATKFKLQQIESFEKEIDETKERMERIETSTNKLIENSEIKFSSALNERIGSISYRWNVIVDRTKSLTYQYENILKKNDEVSD